MSCFVMRPVGNVMFCHGPPRLPLSSPRPALAKAGDPIRGRSRQGRRVGVEVPARCWAASGTTIGAYCFIGPPCPFRSSRRRPACGGSLFRAYRVRARARPSAPARFARLIARARRKGALHPWHRIGVVPRRVGTGRKRSAVAASLEPILARIIRGQASSGKYFHNLEQIGLSACGKQCERASRPGPSSQAKEGEFGGGRLPVSSPWTGSGALHGRGGVRAWRSRLLGLGQWPAAVTLNGRVDVRH